ncbi:hypothetical protein SLA2020_460770 [Shorea laevis]
MRKPKKCNIPGISLYFTSSTQYRSPFPSLASAVPPPCLSTDLSLVSLLDYLYSPLLPILLFSSRGPAPPPPPQES